MRSGKEIRGKLQELFWRGTKGGDNCKDCFAGQREEGIITIRTKSGFPNFFVLNTKNEKTP